MRTSGAFRDGRWLWRYYASIPQCLKDNILWILSGQRREQIGKENIYIPVIVHLEKI